MTPCAAATILRAREMVGAHMESGFDWEQLGSLTGLTALALGESENEQGHIMPSTPAILARLSGLEYLKLSAARIPGSSLLADFAGQLTHLELRGKNKDLPELHHITRLTRLHTLALSFYDNCGAARFWHLRHTIPNLVLW